MEGGGITFFKGILIFYCPLTTVAILRVIKYVVHTYTYFTHQPKVGDKRKMQFCVYVFGCGDDIAFLIVAKIFRT